jgi:hypothetical protein
MNAQVILLAAIGVFKELAIPYYFDNLFIPTLDAYLMAFSMY